MSPAPRRPTQGRPPDWIDLLFSFSGSEAADKAMHSLHQLGVHAARSNEEQRVGDAVLVEVSTPAFQAEQVRRVARDQDLDVVEYPA